PVNHLIALTLKTTKIPYLTIKQNIKHLRHTQQKSHKTVFSNPNQTKILKAANINRTATIIILINN
ncbi:NAD-binding protein, partial [Klebsiella pneumoniae]|uniref:NAD-binding protein n=1 Tax=Klebsiella pneumoniae TaxID=573 RepID=UPI00194FC0D7